MSIGDVTALLQFTVLQILTIAGPLLVITLLVGLLVAILQATTSIQEQTLTFVPKVFTIMLILALLGGVGFSRLGQFTIQLFMRIPEMAG